jgi:hypothetical protein
LVSFALTFIVDSLWLYVLGLVIALIGLARVAPSQRVFRMLDEKLAERGSPLRMTDAWRRSLESGASAASE